MAGKFMDEWEKMAPMARYDANELAKLCQLSVRQLQRNFLQQFARSPQNWLNEQRVKNSALILLTGKQVKAVASELGFKQTSHFCRVFKFYHQLTPSQFKDLGCISEDVAQR